MPEWREVPLGEVLTLQRGFDLPKRMRRPGPYPVVSSSGISGSHDEFKVVPPGVVIGRYGSLGSVHWVTDPYWPLNTALWVKDFKGNDPRFVSYLLQTVSMDGSSAAAVPGVNRNHLHQMVVRRPQRGIQRRIAALLSALDEMIEIEAQRIELLDGLAHRLYREWFSNRCFPGHQRDAVGDANTGTAPIEWGKRSFSDLAEFRNGFAFGPAHQRAVGLPIIKIKELKQGVTASTPRCDEKELARKFIVEPGDLLFSWSADLGVYLWPGERGALNQHLFKVEPSDETMIYFLFHALKDALPDFRKRAQGTTMRHIKRSALSEVTVLVPDRELLARFTRVVEPVHLLVLELHRRRARLASIRDLLLPRLVTGDLDISGIDLGILARPEPE
jgi:type I restriction enzyme, S subunit